MGSNHSTNGLIICFKILSYTSLKNSLQKTGLFRYYSGLLNKLVVFLPKRSVPLKFLFKTLEFFSIFLDSRNLTTNTFEKNNWDHELIINFNEAGIPFQFENLIFPRSENLTRERFCWIIR